MAQSITPDLESTTELCSSAAASVHALRAATAHMERAMGRALEPFGITAAQYELLQVIQLREGLGGGCSELVRHLAAPGPDITRMLDRLDAAGLVSRKRDTVDRRVVHTALTEKASALLEAVADSAAEAEQLIFAGLNEPERLQLTALLRRIRHNCPID